MGIMDFNQSSHSNNIDHHLHLQFNSNHDHHLLLHDHPQKPHLSSQLSLPSLPSLTSQSHNHYQYPNSNTTNTIHHHCLTTFKCQTTTPTTSYISSLTVAGKSIITATSDGEIRSWNLDDENNYNSIDYNILMAAGKGAVKSLVVSGHEKLLFSAHQDHKIRVWKMENHHDHHTDHKKLTRLATLPTLGDRASKLLIPNNHVQIRRHKKCTWVHHVDTVSALALSMNEQLLYSVSWDRTLKIWRTADFKCLESVRNAHDDAINAVAASVDGYIYTGSADKKIKIWKINIEEKKHCLVASLEKHNSGINALALSYDGSVLYSGACDRSIVVWEKDSGGIMEAVGALRGHSKSILCLATVKDVIFSGSADKSIRIWRGKDRNYSCLRVLEGHSGPVKCLTAGIDDCNSCEDGNSYLVYSGGLDCDIKVWQIIVPN